MRERLFLAGAAAGECDRVVAAAEAAGLVAAVVVGGEALVVKRIAMNCPKCGCVLSWSGFVPAGDGSSGGAPAPAHGVGGGGEQVVSKSQEESVDVRKPAAVSITSPDVTFNRSDVGTGKRSYVGGKLAAGDSVETVRAAVRQFVGAEDFAKFLGSKRYCHYFEDADYRATLIREFNFLRAGVKSGEVPIRESPGKALWSYLKPAFAKIAQRRAA